MVFIRKVQNGLVGIVGLALVCLLGTGVAQADLEEGWVSFDGYTTTPTPPEIRVLESNSEQVRLEVDVFGMSVENVDIDGETYQKLEIPEYTWSEEIGSPRVPVIRELVAIPEGAQVSYTVVPTDSIVLNGYNVCPVPQLVGHTDPDGIGWMEEVYTKNDSVYKSSELYPAQYGELITTAYIREQRIAHIAINPVRFNPVTGELVIYPHFEVELLFSSSKGMLTVNTGIFGNICGNAILNYPPTGMGASKICYGKGKGSYTRTTDPTGNITADYLIITGDSLFYSTWIDSLAAKRADYDGFDVVIAEMQDIYNNYLDAQEQYYKALRDYIEDIYLHGTANHTFDGKLGYVLLVGDAKYDNNVTEMVPASYEYGIGEDFEAASDHYYTCVTEITPGSGHYDDFPDLMIGRLSVGNESELSNVVRKILNYEPLPAGATWRKRIVLSSGSYPGDPNHSIWWGAEVSYRYIAPIIPDEYLVSYIYRHPETEVDADSFYYAYPKPESRHYNFKLFNRGELIYIYRGHGGRFDTGSLKSCLHGGDVDSMTNAQSLPFVLNFTCMTGWFDNVTHQDTDNGSYDCMAEQFVNAEGVGAIGFLASSRDSHGDENSAFTKKSFEVIFNDHCYMLGEATMASKIELVKARYLTAARQYNLFGDPAVNLMWEDSPTTKPDLSVAGFDIHFDPVAPSRGDTVTISAFIKNWSSVQAEPACVRFFQGSPSSAGTQIGDDQYTQTVEGWRMDTVQVEWNTDGLPGGWDSIYVQVDPENQVEELLEDNNLTFTPLYLYFYQKGFPYPLNSLVLYPSPVLGDLNEDGNTDVVMATEEGIKVIQWDATPLWTYQTDDPIRSTPAIADVDGDGHLEVIFGTLGGRLYLLDHKGSLRWWTQLNEWVYSSPVVSDLDGNGSLEIIAATANDNGDNIYAIEADSSLLWKRELNGGVYISTPAVGDLDVDGLIDVVVCTASGWVYALRGSDGEETWSTQVGGGIASSPALGDIDHDGHLEIVFGCDDHNIYALNHDGSPCSGFPYATGEVIFSSPALGDIDADGDIEIVVGSGDGKLYALNWDGSLCPGFPYANGRGLLSPVLADLRGGPELEVVVNSDYRYIFAIDYLGRNLKGFPARVEDWLTLSPALGNLDQAQGDQDIEIISNTALGDLYVWDYWEETDPSKIVWGQFHHDRWHTGNYNTVLAKRVSGHITKNTTWSGKILALGDVTVDSGVVLTVQSGTNVRFMANKDNQKSGVDTSRCELIVEGTLHALGDPYPIYLSSTGGPGSWYGIRVKSGGSATMENATIQDGYCGVSFDSAQEGQITSCTIKGNLAYGIKGCATDDLYLAGNTISGNNLYGVYTEDCSPYIMGNNFPCPEQGCAIKAVGDSPQRQMVISGNTIAMPVLECDIPRGGDTTATTGIYVEDASARITNNQISGGDYGIQGVGLDSATVIKGTGYPGQTLDRNLVGLALYADSRPTVSGNDISEYRSIGVACYQSYPLLGDSLIPGTGYNSITPGPCSNQYAVYCEGVTDTIKAENNWWGQAPPDPSWFWGPVDYDPWLTSIGVGPTPKSPLPDHFSLSQNYPNPFNPTTVIRYSLPVDGYQQSTVGGSRATSTIDVSLKVYNVLGQVVRTLVDEPQAPGYYRVRWDGRDSSGRELASGIYFYRIKAGGFVKTQKMVLLQ